MTGDGIRILVIEDEEGRLIRRFDNDGADSADDEFTVDQIEETVRELLK